MNNSRANSTARQGDVLSTKEAADICKVALSTIVYWFDKGLLKGYRTPGGHRRIFRSDLDRFMRDHNMPSGSRLEGEPMRVLFVGQDPALLELFDRTVAASDGRVAVAAASDGYEAGRLVATFQPELLFLDTTAVGVDGLQICAHLKSDPQTRGIEVVAIAGTGTPPPFPEAHVAVVLTRPLDADQLQTVVDEHLS